MNNARASFLANAGWSGAAHSPVAGDLSVRQYTRLQKADASAILMECDPATDTSLPAFLKMTGWLRTQGLSAPKIYAADATTGVALLEDFGNSKLTFLIDNDPTSQELHYSTILDTLILIRNAPIPALETPTARTLCDATKLADEWYPNADSTVFDAFRAFLEPVLKETLTASATVSLRDFHADNIIWLPERANTRKPGLLDYQDAFLTHPAYDLMSLLTDARTEVSPSLRQRMIETYAARTGEDPHSLAEAVAALGAQRNLRILGVFARAARRDGKRQHLKAMPRVYAYFTECCAHPSLSVFSEDLSAALPPPDSKLIESLAS